jgi:diguanylate cyclase (GGDEF)-like protein
MKTPTDNLRIIQRKESHLWFLTLGLLMFYAGILIATYYVILSESYSSFDGLQSTVYRALSGLSILTILFGIYVLHTRTTFRRVKEIFEVHAMRDSLTGLYNRYYFEERMKEEILRVDRNRETLAILLCDIDNFKTINDNQGHQAGDNVLRKVSEGIQEATRGVDLVSRWGGDEIVVVLSKINREGILIAADRIRKRILNIGETENISLDISIGVSLYPEHGRNTDELIRMADRALYIAKKGGDKIHVGEEEYRLDKDAIKIVFQPIVDTLSKKILGYEALSRDPQEKLGILELFKRYQAVGQLKELKALCFTLQLEKAQELKLQKVFINVDFTILNDMKNIPTFKEIEVILEISESEALHDIEGFLQIASKWRAHGFKFAIDDFGAGFISLPFVARLLPDYIKLDRSTIVQAVSSEQFGKFLKDLIFAFKNYSKEGIIAEGIETEKELLVAKRTGNHLVQGFLLGEPKELKLPPVNPPH